jgi:hypothetical protein
VNETPVVMNTCYSFVTATRRGARGLGAPVRRQGQDLQDRAGLRRRERAANQIEGRYALSWADNIWADALALSGPEPGGRWPARPDPVAGAAGLALLMLPLLLRVEKPCRTAPDPDEPVRQPAASLAYVLTLGAGFGMGSVIFLTSLATLAHGVQRSHAGFVLLPMVVCSMLGSMISGRLLNRLGSRTLVLAGFALTALGYAATAWIGLGLWGYLLASMPVGLGIGVLVSGALRTIAIEEAPPAQRGAAQGLVNIFTSIGTCWPPRPSARWPTGKAVAHQASRWPTVAWRC